MGQKKRDKRRFYRFVPSGDLDWIQTSNLLSRNQMRYSVAPRGLLLSLIIYFTSCSVNLFAAANIHNIV